MIGGLPEVPSLEPSALTFNRTSAGILPNIDHHQPCGDNNPGPGGRRISLIRRPNAFAYIDSR